MVEVELKLKARLDIVRQKLLEKGAQLLGGEEEEDLYFQPPTKDFSKTDEALRLRRKGDKCTLTYKGPRLDSVSKTREEIEVAVGDWCSMREMLHRLGFSEAGRVKKYREIYQLRGFLVCLDEVEGLGEFVEIETKAEGDYGLLLKEALTLLEELGAKGPLVRDSYLEMLLKEGLTEEGRGLK